MQKKAIPTNQISLPLDNFRIPNAREFPLNHPRQQIRTKKIIDEDFENAKEYIIVTGFSSLDFIINFLGSKKNLRQKKVRIVLGKEPQSYQPKKKYYKENLGRAIIDYWLEKGISILYGGKIIQLIQLLEETNTSVLDFRILDNLHAKVYVGDTHAMMGSSNFSFNGLGRQLEANKRCEKETADYIEINRIAEIYYEQASPYNQEMIVLLKKLLQQVTWEEALARAIAELLEGDWIKKYPQAFSSLNNFNLWETQIQAIGQALYILDHHGSLLIADPTGAGKTRLGIALKLAILNRLWMNGRGHRSKSLFLCPAAVRDNWQLEASRIYFDNLNILNHATISDRVNAISQNWKHQIANCNILFIDEAHNFLSKYSKRSKNLKLNNADHIILLTATPINKKEEDLLRLIEIMDIDNLSDEAIEKYEKIVKHRTKIAKEDLQIFREVLREFTIRRTKKDLNRIIDRNPSAYRNRLGNLCRFPKHLCEVYPLQEQAEDIALMQQINELVNDLKGLIWLNRIMLKEYELEDIDRQTNIIHGKIKAAAGLAAYHVQNRIRSSRPALIEHLEGTNEALQFIGLPKRKEDKQNGNFLQKLHNYKKSLPKTNCSQLPSWLSNLEEYQLVCEKEIRTYQEITALARKMSNQREIQKVKHLIQLLDKHDLLIAFDNRLITLEYFNDLIKQERPTIKPLVITGKSSKKEKKNALEIFGLDSTEKGLIGLCSDAMAEGVNLQRASTVVLLDMPSVMRLAEQRIGRIDRMDSPHTAITIYWPDDHTAFALQTDENFFRTVNIVDTTIGGNIDLPEKFIRKRYNAKQIIQLYQEEQANKNRFADGIQDAFGAVRQLKEGNTPLLTPSIYEEMRSSKANVFSQVSFVGSKKPFGFFALKGLEQQSPRWILIEESNRISMDIPYICERLRSYLKEAENINQWKEDSSLLMETFLEYLHESQIQLLPNKKRRALQLLKKILEYHLKKNKTLDKQQSKQLKRLLQILSLQQEANEWSIDYYQLANKWIEWIQPLLNEKRANTRKIVHYGNFFNQLKKIPLDSLELDTLEDNLLLIQPIDRRIVACIIGIPQ